MSLYCEYVKCKSHPTGQPDKRNRLPVSKLLRNDSCIHDLRVLCQRGSTVVKPLVMRTVGKQGQRNKVTNPSFPAAFVKEPANGFPNAEIGNADIDEERVEPL